MAKKSTSPFVPGVGGTHASKVMQSLSSTSSNLPGWVHLTVPCTDQKQNKKKNIYFFLLTWPSQTCCCNNPQRKNAESSDYHLPETAVHTSTCPPRYDPRRVHRPTTGPLPRPYRPHLLHGAHVSARLSQPRPTLQIRRSQREEPPPHTVTLRLQTDDRKTQSQPQGAHQPSTLLCADSRTDAKR